jgi:hypothetical protein
MSLKLPSAIVPQSRIICVTLAISSEEIVVPSKRNGFLTHILRVPHSKANSVLVPENSLLNLKESPKDLLWKADRRHWASPTEKGFKRGPKRKSRSILQKTEAARVKAGLKRSRKGRIEGCIVVVMIECSDFFYLN